MGMPDFVAYRTALLMLAIACRAVCSFFCGFGFCLGILVLRRTFRALGEIEPASHQATAFAARFYLPQTANVLDKATTC